MTKDVKDEDAKVLFNGFTYTVSVPSNYNATVKFIIITCLTGLLYETNYAQI